MGFLDLRVALRRLTSSKSYVAVAVVTLGLTIGVNTAFFSYLKAVAWAAFPYPEPHQLVYIGNQWIQSSPALTAVSAPSYLSIQETLKDQAQVGLASALVFSVQQKSRPEPVEGMRVTGSIFEVLGQAPALGRIFSTQETADEYTVVLSHRFWQDKFGASPELLGSKLTIDERPYTIIGVMPANFFILYESPRFWIPMTFTEREKLQPFTPIGDVVGRLREGVSVSQINARLDKLVVELTERYSVIRFFLEEQGFHLRALGLHEKWQGDFAAFRNRLLLFQAAAGFVLLLGCLNMAQLMMARARARQKELAIRQAIGGSPPAAGRAVLTENLLVFVIGGIAALAVAPMVLQVLEFMNFAPSPFGAAIALDRELFAYALGLAVFGGLIFGSLPTFAAMRLDLRQIMADSGEALPSGRARVFGASAIVVTEFALAFVLVASTILMVESLDRLVARQTGFEPAGILTARVTLPDPPYSDWPRRRDFVQMVLRELRASPGVTDAAAVSTLPFADRRHSVIHSIDGIDRYRGGKNPNSRAYIVSPGYFETMQIPLLHGRFLSERDRPDTQRVVVVDERFVERELGGEEAIGKRLVPGMARAWPSNMRERIPWYVIVGVVGDVMHGNASNPETSDVISRGIPAPVDAGSMYFTIEQTGSFEDPVSATYVLKGRGSEKALTQALSQTLAKVDPGVSFRNVATLQAHIRRSWRTQETQQFLLRLFAGLAVLLASVGVFGVMTSQTLDHKKELALRLALGETRGEVVGRVLRRSIRLSGAGVVLGTAATYPWIGFVQSVHPQISFGSPLVYILVGLFLAALGAVSSLLPAIRSAWLEPIRVLRQ